MALEARDLVRRPNSVSGIAVGSDVPELVRDQKHC